MGEAGGGALGDHDMGYVKFSKRQNMNVTGGYGATGATKCAVPRQETPLLKYINLLSSFEPEATGDLPPVPPFDHPPERPIAWSAWWDTLQACRRMKDSKES